MFFGVFAQRIIKRQVTFKNFLFLFYYNYFIHPSIRNRDFMHRRMDETAGNVEISNPMFSGEELEDDLGVNPQDPINSFHLEVDDKVSKQLHIS